MQHVLIIGKVWPEPQSSAAGSRTMQLIELFKELNWKVSFATATGQSQYAANLLALNVESYNIEVNNEAFDRLIKLLNPSIVIFDRFITEEQFGWRVAENCPGALRILDTIDLRCLRLARQTSLKENRKFELNELLKTDAAKREIASIYRCDISLMVSYFEIEILEKVFNIQKDLLHYAPLWYKGLTHEHTSKIKKFSERENFVSIGNFLHEPNWDAVQFLKKEIWPIIRQQLPKAELHIYGAYPSQKVFELNNAKEGFLIKGRADNALRVVSAARISLAPLRFGAGIKGKLLDAMLCGTPTVTTAIGAEGMQGNLKWNGEIAESPENIAKAAIHLYTHETDWLEAQKNGYNLINSVFSKNEHEPLLTEKINNVLNNLTQHRQANFIGNLLQHQSFSATKYMSLWIAEKNKTVKP